MIRRLGLLATATLLSLLAPAAPLEAATPPPPPLDLNSFVGDWTPDKAAGAPVTGNAFTMTKQTKSSESAVGPNNKGNFERYCDPAANTNITYFVIAYSWSPGPALMGGCHSNSTEQHVYFWGSNSDYGYVRQAKVAGETLLKGEWNIFDEHGAETGHTLVAHRAVATFVTHVKNRGISHDHRYRETEISGVGEIRLEMVPKAGCGADPWDSVDSDGSIDIDVTKVGGPNIVDLYNLKLAVNQPKSGTFDLCSHGPTYEHLIPLTVTNSDQSEKKACAIGSSGVMTLEDRDRSDGGDIVLMRVPSCNLKVTLHASQQAKGNHVVVALDLNERGY